MSDIISLSNMLHQTTDATARESILKAALKSFCEVHRTELLTGLEESGKACSEFTASVTDILDAMYARIVLLEEKTVDYVSARALWKALEMYKASMVDELNDSYREEAYNDVAYYATAVNEVQCMMNFIRSRASIE